MRHIAVGEVMTTDLITVQKEGILSEAVEILKQNNFHHIPVVDENGRLCGILSLTDIDRLATGASLFKNPNKDDYDEVIFQTMWIRDVMTKSVVELSPDDTIYDAYEIFCKNQFRALPVVENDSLKGIITPLDILEYFFSN